MHGPAQDAWAGFPRLGLGPPLENRAYPFTAPAVNPAMK